MLDKFERLSALTERKRIHCVDCKRLSIHNLEARCTGSWSDPYHDVTGGYSYSIFRCGACDEVCYETVGWNSEDFDVDVNGQMVAGETVFQYPAPVSSHFTFNLESTPSRLNGILEEMLYCLAGSKMILATVGLRMAIEFIVKDKSCTGRDLKKKIGDLRAMQFIDDDQQQLLQRIRLKGNAGAHEAIGMKAAELIAGMSIIEGLLEKLYNGPARHDATIKKAKQMIREETDHAIDEFA